PAEGGGPKTNVPRSGGAAGGPPPPPPGLQKRRLGRQRPPVELHAEVDEVGVEILERHPAEVDRGPDRERAPHREAVPRPQVEAESRLRGAQRRASVRDARVTGAETDTTPQLETIRAGGAVEQRRRGDAERSPIVVLV